MLLCGGGCASLTKIEDWQGRKIDDAIAKFGTPSQIMPGQNGQKYYVWRLHHQSEIPRMELDANGHPVERNIPHDSVVTWMFLVGADGGIISFVRSET
jgi:hypothetical protein